MTYDNPYEPPEIPAEMVEPEWPAEGVFRDGKLLVLKYGTPLPAICVRTGLPANAICPVEINCQGNNDSSVEPVNSFWARFRLEVPVTSAWLAKHRLATRAGFIMLWLGFGLLLFVPFYLNANYATAMEVRHASIIPGFIILALLVTGSILQDHWKPLHSIQNISRGYLWITGADRKFLAQLPDWPASKLSFWQRFWV